MTSNRSPFPVWLAYALLCAFCWGLWGFLAKVGSASATPLQLQVLFSLGMIPVALGSLAKMRWKLECDLVGAGCGILTGIGTGVGIIGYYAAMHDQDASVVTPLTGIFPLLTVILAVLFLRERLNRVQIGGIFLALASIVILSL